METAAFAHHRKGMSKYFDLIREWRKNEALAFHDYHNVFRETFRALQAYVAPDASGLRMLEIGCGRRFGITLLFHSLGAKITGIDIESVNSSFSLPELSRLRKRTGFARFAKTLSRRYLFDRTYYQVLERAFQREFGRPLKKRNVDVRIMDACSLQFPSLHLNFVFSNAVFEHIDNIEAACREVHRVLVPGGIAYLSVHLFPSLSGGHNLKWKRPDERPSKSVPPWDHLRQNLFPANTHLNRLRESDYLTVFQRYFSIMDVRSKYEGERLLTDQISKELSGFSRDELLKRSIKVVLRK